MQLAVGASTFVAAALRSRRRRLLARPDLDLVVAAEAMSETEHELHKPVALLVQRGHLDPAPAAQLFEEALAAIAEKVRSSRTRSTLRVLAKPGSESLVTHAMHPRWPLL